MEYTIKESHPCERLITVQIGSDLISAAKSEYYDEVGKDAAVPGYRKGKTPREILETHFAESAREAVIKKLITLSIKKISEAEKMNIIAYPKVEDLKYSDSLLKFQIEVELDPEIKLAEYKGITAKRTSFEIAESEIAEVIEKIRESFASFIPVTREALMNDYLIADYDVEFEGKPKEDHKDEWIFLHEHDALGDFSTKLIGVKSGDDRSFEIALAPDHPREELRGKKAKFNVHVKEVKEKSLPKVDDELAKLAGEYQSLEELRKAVNEDVKRRKEQEQEAQVETQILNTLVDKNQFSMSRGVVERQIDKLVHDAIERMVQRGYPKDQAEKQHEALAKEFRSEAEKQVRLSFILDRVARAENIKVSQEDLNQRIEQMGKQYHLPVEKVLEHFKKEENLENLIEQIVNEKTFKFIKENAQIINGTTH